MAGPKVAALPFSVALDIKEICYRFRLWHLCLWLCVFDICPMGAQMQNSGLSKCDTQTSLGLATE